ncbi:MULTISPECIES: TetR/AcrR family transcriptional regulator [unclassified Roseovarius]|uniref:TetR/AcrR family transcriptional regulator n=1 Tax=unclassified Roseovarius TaxID=2614913 RepID=UPI00273D3543|nr:MULTISPECIES: TetR/AcrR family transcriptional regulator [unclassified Roseovarius]
MARPEIKEARREQVLDAFEICVAKYGVEGATLAKTAEQAGLARPLVRHNVGNREELISALIERFLDRSREKMQAFVDMLPANDKARHAVEWLFDPQYADTHLVQVAYALIAFSADDTAMAEKMQIWVRDFEEKLASLIADDHPQSAPEQIAAVSTGVMGIYFNFESLSVLGNADALAAPSKQAALMLLDALDPKA